MSQGTPRKFSEKIAILERKQNEEEELFHSVMREVRGITSTKTPTQPGYQSPNGGMMSPNTLSPTTAGCSTMPGMPLPGTQLVAGPPHPLTMPPWNRPGGSLPNVHAMVQHPPQAVDPYAQWNYWQHPSQVQNAAAQAAAHRVRTRSPGATHYHPYMNVAAQRPNERGAPTMENGMIPANVHLQLPDPSWSRARSDPAIHANAMNALYAQQNAQQQWLRMNGMTGMPGQGMPMIPVYPVPSGQQQGQQQHSPPQHVMSPVDNRPQSSQGGGPPSPIDMAVGSLPNMHSPLMQQQQQAAAAAAAAVQQRSNSISCYPT
ncbi:Protein CRTC-1, partial [Aphelenchoides avenae]